MKNLLLVIGKILTLFVNTVTADVKNSLVNRDNLGQPIQIQFPEQQKNFSQFFSAVLRSRLNFEHFQKKDDPHSSCICDITHS